MQNIRLIALDLDGTLLDSDKALSAENAAALQRAADMGIEIVPATGRFFAGMPEVIRRLPFLHYAITINGAQVYDVRRGTAIAKAEIPAAQAVEIMRFLDSLPVIYDCYMENWGWMTRTLQERAAEFIANVHYLKMLRELRTPVDELKQFIAQRGSDVQKIQFFTNDPALRTELLETLESRFPGIAASSAVPNNVEINHARATKGNALTALAAHLGIPAAQTVGFGDNLNDLTMLSAAGVGVAMGNALPEVKQLADLVTAGCDESGVARALEILLAEN